MNFIPKNGYLTFLCLKYSSEHKFIRVRAEYCKKQEKETLSHACSLNDQTFAFRPLFSQPFCFAWTIFSKNSDYRDTSSQCILYKAACKTPGQKNEQNTSLWWQELNKKVFDEPFPYSLIIDRFIRLKSMNFGYESLA